MALVSWFSQTWTLTRRSSQVLFPNWSVRSVRVRAGQRGGKIPSLMRYVPKEARRSQSEKLETVQFPASQVVEEGDGFDADDFDAEYGAVQSSKSMRSRSDEWGSEKQRSDLGLASFRKEKQEMLKRAESSHASEATPCEVSRNLQTAAGEPEIGEDNDASTRDAESSGTFQGQNSDVNVRDRLSSACPLPACEATSELEEETETSAIDSDEEIVKRKSTREELCSKFPGLSLFPASKVSHSRAEKSGITSAPEEEDVDYKTDTDEETVQGKPSGEEIRSKFAQLHLVPASRLVQKPKERVYVDLGEPADEDDNSFEEQEESEPPLTPQDNPGERSTARNYAIFLLGKRQRTAVELRKKLSEKNYSPRVADNIISELKEEGLQSDSSYAEVFARSRWNARGWGPKRIKHELTRKGVDGAIIEGALQRVFQSENDKAVEGSEETRWGMSKQAEEHILALSARKWKCGGNISDESRTRRLAGWLLRRGFSWKVINGITKDVQRLSGS